MPHAHCTVVFDALTTIVGRRNGSRELFDLPAIAFPQGSCADGAA
jgi:hypothetical protein